MPEKPNRIYSATYSNVPVYEYSIAGNHVMRRRSDDWINATHILKVAEFDKPARTRILEREVQKGVHEKVQGGYGKYQGTWIPLPEGRLLAERNGVLEKLLPIFDYIPGDRSPPPAPKHATAASSKPKASRPSAAARRVAAPPVHTHVVEEPYEGYTHAMNGNATPEQASRISDSDVEMLQDSQYSSRKRKRGMEEPPAMSYADREHLLWTDELLDFFMLQNSNEPLPMPPEPPASIDLNRAIDEKGHTPMHWAAAMGDLNVVKDLLQRGARIDTLAVNGESPLMRAVMFTNNWDKQTMDRLIHLLHPTAGLKDWFGSTVFHHISVTTCSKSRYQCARYYLDTILNKLNEIYSPQQIQNLLDQQDTNGDTAVQLAARFGARKCVRSFMNHGASIDIPNGRGETADEMIKELNTRRHNRNHGSSSPFREPTNGITDPQRSSSGPNFPLSPSRQRSNTYRSEAATLLASQLPTLIASRTEALATAIEAQLAERDLEAADAERLLEQRREEIAQIQRQSMALAGADEDSNGFDEQQRAELDALLHESERLLELEQSFELGRLVRDEESKIPPHMRTSSTSSSSTPSISTIDTEKLHLALALRAQQAARAVFVADTVAAQSLAGGGGGSVSGNGNGGPVEQRHEIYKRLITGALNVRAEDVEAMLPEMLRELEDARDDAGPLGAAGAMGLGPGEREQVVPNGNEIGPGGGEVDGGGGGGGGGGGRGLFGTIGEQVRVMG